MKCPYCSYSEDKVVDSRTSQDGSAIRRRRQCLKCKRRYTTYEKIEKVPLKVIKKDNRREDFDRGKLLSGIMTACEKRPISIEKIEEVVDAIEQKLESEFEKEVLSKDIGEMVMQRLQTLDQVAFVRFASVYRQFKDINQFSKEVKGLLSK